MMMWFTYRAWLVDYPPTVVPALTEQAAGTAPELPLELPQLESPADSLPGLTESGAPVETPPLEAVAPERVVRVRTDVFDIMIDTQGGDLVTCPKLADAALFGRVGEQHGRIPGARPGAASNTERAGRARLS